MKKFTGYNCRHVSKEIELFFEPCRGGYSKTSSTVPQHLSPCIIKGASVFYSEHSSGYTLLQKIKTSKHIIWYCHLGATEETDVIVFNNDDRLFLTYMLHGTFFWKGPERQIKAPKNVYHLIGTGRENKYTINLNKGNYECVMIELPLHIYDDIFQFYKNNTDDLQNCFKGYPFGNFFGIDHITNRNIRRLIEGKRSFSFKRNFADIFREEYVLRLINQYLSGEEVLFRQQKTKIDDLQKLENIEDYILNHLSDAAKLCDHPLLIRNVIKHNNMTEANFRMIIQEKYNYSWEQLIYHVRMKKAKELLMARPYAPMSEISDLLGYGNPSNFTRAIREFYKKPPSCLRKMGCIAYDRA